MILPVEKLEDYRTRICNGEVPTKEEMRTIVESLRPARKDIFNSATPSKPKRRPTKTVDLDSLL